MYQNKTTERRQIQLVLSCQKYWFHISFYFLTKRSPLPYLIGFDFGTAT